MIVVIVIMEDGNGSSYVRIKINKYLKQNFRSMEYLTIAITAAIFAIIMKYYLAGYIYDFLIVPLNASWYTAFIEK